MQTLLRRPVPSRPSLLWHRSCQLVVGRRYSPRTARFHTSAVVRQSQDDPPNINEQPSKVDAEQAPDATSDAHTRSTEPTNEGDARSDRIHKAKELGSGSGSALRRANRSRRPKEVVPVEISDLFIKHNVILSDDLQKSVPVLDILDKTAAARLIVHEPDDGGDASPQPKREPAGDTAAAAPSTTEPRYQLHQDIWNEILATIRSSLSLPTSFFSNSFPAQKVHLLLQCPKDGGIYFLDSIVEKAASIVGADLLRLDTQDLAEIGGNSLGEEAQPTPYSLRSLAYDAHQLTSKQGTQDSEDAAEEEEEEEAEDMETMEDDSHQAGRGQNFPFALPRMSKVSAVPIRAIFGSLEDLFKSGKVPVNNVSVYPPRSGNTSMQVPRVSSHGSDQWKDMKMVGVAAAMLGAVETKLNTFRSESQTDLDADAQEHSRADHLSSVPSSSGQTRQGRPLIVQIRDLKEIQSTTNGTMVIDAFLQQIRRRRKAGQEVVLIGTVSSADFVPSVSRPGFKDLQSEHEDGPARTIVVTPPRSAFQDGVLVEDQRRRMREINLRHLQDMVRQRASDPTRTSALLSRTDLRLDSSVEYSSGLEESVWPFDRVHRVAVTALGLIEPDGELTEATISKALALLDSSDETKFQWAIEEARLQQELDSAHPRKEDSTSPLKTAATSTEAKMKRIRKICNTHEKKLLGGVINPENIRITFSDVHATSDTITALKTLTSLSLIRPEAFSYGVLATDNIPGLLLYGPPGTGKTLLAKAVAKESGATVLEVSGSEVYDMFVGEGEKNVKAIFTLARKLSPCVVFIDEADAIFASRSGQGNRTSHRELINQFLREWDGMSDFSVFIMVATNRPFDLDDAVLRRLPRRLLIDLPVEKDREAILRIHLKDEILDPSVSLSELANKTTFYSGSDLKNLSVAAALTCVREESDEAARHAADAKPYKYPEKRTLVKRHFDKATEEISASISEDMSSLAAIRKFDEKYGDRKGRRKKGAAWGFSSMADAEHQIETGRVRN